MTYALWILLNVAKVTGLSLCGFEDRSAVWLCEQPAYIVPVDNTAWEQNGTEPFIFTTAQFKRGNW